MQNLTALRTRITKNAEPVFQQDIDSALMVDMQNLYDEAQALRDILRSRVDERIRAAGRASLGLQDLLDEASPAKLD